MNLKHIAWFVTGALMEYYDRVGWDSKQYELYTRDSIEKVWRYLTVSSQTIDGSYSDIQAHIALEAGRVFFKPKVRGYGEIRHY